MRIQSGVLSVRVLVQLGKDGAGLRGLRKLALAWSCERGERGEMGGVAETESSSSSDESSGLSCQRVCRDAACSDRGALACHTDDAHGIGANCDGRGETGGAEEGIERAS